MIKCEHCAVAQAGRDTVAVFHQGTCPADKSETEIPGYVDRHYLATLRQIAQEATPGPWREHRDEVLLGETWARLPSSADAKFVAWANPSVVLALLDKIARLGGA